MSKRKVIIIEDDKDISEVIAYNLEKESYKVARVYDGQKAISSIKKEKPSLVILDIMLPGKDGLEICKEIRSTKDMADLPIIMLTAKAQETDKVVGLEIGADDYMTKPFSPRELIARVKAILRRQAIKEKPKREIMKAGAITIDTMKHKVTVFGKGTQLTSTEYKLLLFLAERPGMVLSRDKILDSVLGYSSEIYDRTVDAHVKSLRRKLGKARDYIETVRGAGYRFKEI